MTTQFGTDTAGFSVEGSFYRKTEKLVEAGKSQIGRCESFFRR